MQNRVHKCSQLENALPMVDIYDDVFGDIDPTYSTIPVIDPINNQQRYIVCIIMVYLYNITNVRTHIYIRTMHILSIYFHG